MDKHQYKVAPQYRKEEASDIDLTELVHDFAEEYKWHLESQDPAPVSVGDGINSGLCDIFAERVKSLFPQAEVLYDRDIDHVFVRIGNRYYDAENPRGVTAIEMMMFGGKILSQKQ